MNCDEIFVALVIDAFVAIIAASAVAQGSGLKAAASMGARPLVDQAAAKEAAR